MQQQLWTPPAKQLWQPGMGLTERELSQIGRNVRVGRNAQGGRGAGAVVTPLTVLGSAVKLWLRADLDCTPGSWLDWSGNSNDFLQATGGAQPTIEPTGYSGQPSVLFDGVDDVLINTGALAATLWAAADTPYSAYIPVQFLTLAGTKTAFAAGNSDFATRNLQIADYNLGNWANSLRDNTNTVKVANFGTADGNRTLLEIHCSGTTVVIAVNGVESGALDMNLGLATFNNLSLGAVVRSTTIQFANFRTPEVVLCDAVSSAGERTDMRAYFANRYP
jgi:hypothetical protein